MPEMSFDGPAILVAVRAVAPSRLSPIHGEEHWRRVAWHGLSLASEVTGADAELAVLFGIFHDSMRFNDGRDPEHGRRGGALAREFNAGLLHLSPERIDLLEGTCADHTGGATTPDPTAGVCWDSDRLDLVRLGYRLDPHRLSTAPARTRDAAARARALVERPPTWEAIFARLSR